MRIQELEHQLAELSSLVQGTSPQAPSYTKPEDLLKKRLAEAEARAKEAEARAAEAEAREASAREQLENDRAMLLERARKAAADRAEAQARRRRRRAEEERKAGEEEERAVLGVSSVSAATEMVMETLQSKGWLKQRVQQELQRREEEERAAARRAAEEAGEEAAVAEEAEDEEAEAPAAPAPGPQEAPVLAEGPGEGQHAEMERLAESIRATKEEYKRLGMAPKDINKTKEVVELVQRLQKVKRKLAPASASPASGEAVDAEAAAAARLVAAAAAPAELSPEQEEARVDLQDTLAALRGALLENAGFTEAEVEEDPDVRELQEALESLGVDVTKVKRVKQWDLPVKFKTQKEALTDWYHRKYQRRTGRADAHWFNQLSGKSHREKKRMTKQWIQRKIKGLSQAKRKQRRDQSLPDDDGVPLELTEEEIALDLKRGDRPVDSKKVEAAAKAKALKKEKAKAKKEALKAKATAKAAVRSSVARG